jgi:hypothetical protein
MAHYWRYGDPYTLSAVCAPDQAAELIQYDHHQVVVQDCWGILITYPWLTLESAEEPRIALVHCNPAPNHTASEDQIRVMIRKHPLAPPHVQALIDQLDFQIVS